MGVTQDWVAVDFDGTLAVKGTGAWGGHSDVGAPIMPMVEFIKQLLDQGERVKIFTARAAMKDFDPKPIEAFCQKYLGRVLEITCQKDEYCKAIFDDIAYGVIPNTGQIIW